MGDFTRHKPDRVTIIDVAKAASVSPATVSNTLSGKRKVDSDTCARVEAAIKELGYVPNLAARGMRTGRSHSIAIYSSMPPAVAAGISRLGFLMEVAASAAVAALEFNSALVLVPPIEDPFKTLQNISMDGALILEPDEVDAVIGLMQDRGIPTVSIGRPPGQDSHYVDLDYQAMAALLIDHLIEAGARQIILVVGRSTRYSNDQFRQLYKDRAAEMGMRVRILEVDEQNAQENAATAITGELANGDVFDAVLAPIDATATGVMHALRLAGRRVPEDVKVVTRYDGVRAQSETPQLTALDLRLEQVGRLAARNLAKLIEGEDLSLRTAAPSPHLVVRGSSLKR